MSSLQPLTDCVKANSAGKGFIMGWGVTDGGTGSSNSVTASIAATNAALAAAGVPGITDANTGSGGVSGLSNNPCGDPVPWTGIQCENGRITQVYAPHQDTAVAGNSERSEHVLDSLHAIM